MDPFLKGLRDLTPELNDLEAAGNIIVDPYPYAPCGWRVEPQVMLWWVADELIRAVRPDTPFEDWLCAQELDHLLTKNERETFAQAVRGAAEVLQQGSSKLIESFATGLGKSLGGG